MMFGLWNFSVCKVNYAGRIYILSDAFRLMLARSVV